jgi:hypothetical protein
MRRSRVVPDPFAPMMKMGPPMRAHYRAAFGAR